MRMLLIGLALATAAGCSPSRQQPAADQQSAESVEGGQGVDRSHQGKPAPAVAFAGPDGDEVTLAELRGPMLVNVWATWCAPCVKELPTLNALAGKNGGKGALAVVAVSQDNGPQPSVEAFLAKLKADKLTAYHDPKMALSGALGAEILPTSVLYDAQGREVWRYVGDLDWTGPEAAKLLAEAGPGAG